MNKIAPDRFKWLTLEIKDVLPEGYSAPLSIKTARRLIAERIQARAPEQQP